MPDLVSLVDAVSSVRVVVLGDALLDGYLRGSADRVCREAPVPVVSVTGVEEVPGGAANLAANAASLGARVELLSVVGDDADGVRLCAALQAAGVDTTGVLTEPGRRTAVKRRLVVADQMVARYDEGRPQAPAAAVEQRLIALLDGAIERADVVVVSDYDYGVLTDAVVRHLAALQARTPRLLVVDAKNLVRYRDLHPTAVKPNYDEVRPLLTGDPAAAPSRADAVLASCETLPSLTGAEIVAVTLDREGSIVCERGRPAYRTYSRETPNTRACGAGDAFTAALALALAAGADTPAAAELASAAATVTLRYDGTVTCSAAELREHVADVADRLRNADRLAETVAYHRREGRRVAFTNGCFDILHRGHVDFLNRAKASADVLVVGLNSDESIRRLKGPERPVNPLEDRAQVLGALSCVDHIVAFDGDTATELIERLRPDVYVKGGDYTPDMLPEADVVRRVGAELRILPYLEDRSTTGIIRRIRSSPAAGSAGPQAKSSTVDVLIPTYRRPAALAATLTALAMQTMERFRVVVSDQTEEYDATSRGEVLAAVRLLRARGREVELHRHLPRRGLAEQRAFLLDQARAPYALFLDDDVVCEPYVLRQLMSVLARERCGFVGMPLVGLSYHDDVRPHQQAMEPWRGPVRPELVRPGDAAWERHHLHSAANAWHVQRQLGLTPENPLLYKVAWVGGCVLYDVAKLQAVGGFGFWPELPEEHCGEDVVAQQRVMAAYGGCGVLPTGAFHQELETTVVDRRFDAPYVLSP